MRDRYCSYCDDWRERYPCERCGNRTSYAPVQRVSEPADAALQVISGTAPEASSKPFNLPEAK